MKRIHFLFVLLILFSSCNSKKSKDQDGNTGESAITEVAVEITDNSYTAPDSIQAGYIKLKLSNKASEMHSAHLIKLDEGYTTDQLIKTYADSMRTGGERPKWMTHIGGVISAPGSSEIELLLNPGNYSWVCVMGDESAPHFAGHEHKSLIVYGTVDKSQSLEASQLTINMTDENFELDRPIVKGSQSIDIINSGTKYHLAAISKLNENATADDVRNWFTNFDGPPPAQGVISTSAIGPQLTARINVEFESGEYVLFCMANAEGRFHLLDGAIQSITVK